MKLLTLTLRNFRQHRESHIAFGDGVTGIIGPNGAGKTTIVEALAFALFGSRALRGKVEELRTRGAPRAAVPTVELRCEHDQMVLRIVRTTQDAELYVGGESLPVVSGNRDVTQRISALLGMSYEEFFATYFTEQNGLEFLASTKGAADRERFIIRMMGYDRLEKVQEVLRADRRDKRQELIGREAALGKREEIEDRVSKEATELKAKESKLAEFSRILEQAEKDEVLAKRAVAELEELRARYVASRKALEALETKEGEIKKRRAAIASRIEGLCRDQPYGDEHALEAKHNAVREERERTAAALEALEAKLASEEERVRHNLAELHGKIEAASLEERRLRAQDKTLESLKGETQCPTCLQPLANDVTHVRRHLEEQLQELRQRRGSFEHSLRMVGEEGLAELRSEVKRVREMLSRNEQEDRTLELMRSTMGELLSQQHALEGEQSSILNEKEALQRELAQIPFSDSEYEIRRAGFETKQRLTEVARLQRVRAEGEVNSSQRLLQRSKEELERHDALTADMQQLRTEVLTYEETDTVLTEVRRSLSASLRPRLAALASEFVVELTDGRYHEIRVSDEYAPQLVEDGEPKGVISGGEEDILNLCMRLALSQLIADRAGQQFSMLILDEVFGSLDEHRRSNVLQLLERLASRFQQIVLITHFDDLKESLQNLMYVDYDAASGHALVGEIEEEFGAVANI
ncbi:MAG: SMC family ATPase [Bdellovibrionota bacterium]|nr:MAG: SMC family ATPase [Bdellovibrionota bacterium]